MTLHEYISKSHIEERRARELASKIGQALEYLHDNGIIIRNLDDTGILMSDTEKDLTLNVPRISRLNKAKVMGHGETEFCNGIEGDIRFRAPEVIMSKSYKQKADVWSYGIILFFVLTGVLPFDYDNQGIIMTRAEQNMNVAKNIKYKIKHSQPNYDLILEKGFSKEAYELVQKLLNRNPETRLTMKSANIHPWFMKNIESLNKSEQGLKNDAYIFD